MRSLHLATNLQVRDMFLKGDKKMLGMGLLGTILVIALVIWLVRRV
jgi:hypothetical protein